MSKPILSDEDCPIRPSDIDISSGDERPPLIWGVFGRLELEKLATTVVLLCQLPERNSWAPITDAEFRARYGRGMGVLRPLLSCDLPMLVLLEDGRAAITVEAIEAIHREHPARTAAN